MGTARSARGHVLVVALMGLTVLAHVALAVVPSARPVWALVVSGVLALVALALLAGGLAAPRARFGGDAEDSWLVACAAVGMAGVALGLVITLVEFAAGRGGLDLWGLGALLVDALTVRIAVVTLRRVPAGGVPR